MKYCISELHRTTIFRAITQFLVEMSGILKEMNFRYCLFSIISRVE